MSKKLTPWALLAIVVTILSGALVFVDFFIPNPQMDVVGEVLLEGVMILAAFGLLLGILNLLMAHSRRLVAGQGSRLGSAVLLVALVGTLLLGVLGPASQGMSWLFDYVYFPLQATMAALLAFFIVRALFRSFQLCNVDAALLLLSSIIMLMLQAPFAASLWPNLPLVREWVMTVPVMAVMRGLLLGIALGTLSTSLRVLLAVDRPYLGE